MECVPTKLPGGRSVSWNSHRYFLSRVVQVYLTHVAASARDTDALLTYDVVAVLVGGGLACVFFNQTE